MASASVAESAALSPSTSSVRTSWPLNHEDALDAPCTSVLIAKHGIDFGEETLKAASLSPCGGMLAVTTPGGRAAVGIVRAASETASPACELAFPGTAQTIGWVDKGAVQVVGKDTNDTSLECTFDCVLERGENGLAVLHCEKSENSDGPARCSTSSDTRSVRSTAPPAGTDSRSDKLSVWLVFGNGFQKQLRIPNLQLQEMVVRNLPPDAAHLGDHSPLFATGTYVGAVVVGQQRSDVVRNVVLFSGAERAAALCQLNGWSASSLPLLSLRLGLENRRADAVRSALADVPEEQIGRAAQILSAHARDVVPGIQDDEYLSALSAALGPFLFARARTAPPAEAMQYVEIMHAVRDAAALRASTVPAAVPPTALRRRPSATARFPTPLPLGRDTDEARRATRDAKRRDRSARWKELDTRRKSTSSEDYDEDDNRVYEALRTGRISAALGGMTRSESGACGANALLDFRKRAYVVLYRTVCRGDVDEARFMLERMGEQVGDFYRLLAHHSLRRDVRRRMLAVLDEAGELDDEELDGFQMVEMLERAYPQSSYVTQFQQQRSHDSEYGNSCAMSTTSSVSGGGASAEIVPVLRSLSSLRGGSTSLPAESFDAEAAAMTPTSGMSPIGSPYAVQSDDERSRADEAGSNAEAHSATADAPRSLLHPGSFPNWSRRLAGHLDQLRDGVDDVRRGTAPHTRTQSAGTSAQVASDAKSELLPMRGKDIDDLFDAASKGAPASRAPRKNPGGGGYLQTTMAWVQEWSAAQRSAILLERGHDDPDLSYGVQAAFMAVRARVEDFVALVAQLTAPTERRRGGGGDASRTASLPADAEVHRAIADALLHCPPAAADAIRTRLALEGILLADEARSARAAVCRRARAGRFVSLRRRTTENGSNSEDGARYGAEHDAGLVMDSVEAARADACALLSTCATKGFTFTADLLCETFRFTGADARSAVASWAASTSAAKGSAQLLWRSGSSANVAAAAAAVSAAAMLASQRPADASTDLGYNAESVSEVATEEHDDASGNGGGVMVLDGAPPLLAVLRRAVAAKRFELAAALAAHWPQPGGLDAVFDLDVIAAALLGEQVVTVSRPASPVRGDGNQFHDRVLLFSSCGDVSLSQLLARAIPLDAQHVLDVADHAAAAAEMDGHAREVFSIADADSRKRDGAEANMRAVIAGRVAAVLRGSAAEPSAPAPLSATSAAAAGSPAPHVASLIASGRPLAAAAVALRGVFASTWTLAAAQRCALETALDGVLDASTLAAAASFASALGSSAARIRADAAAALRLFLHSAARRAEPLATAEDANELLASACSIVAELYEDSDAGAGKQASASRVQVRLDTVVGALVDAASAECAAGGAVELVTAALRSGDDELAKDALLDAARAATTMYTSPVAAVLAFAEQHDMTARAVPRLVSTLAQKGQWTHALAAAAGLARVGRSSGDEETSRVPSTSDQSGVPAASEEHSDGSKSDPSIKEASYDATIELVISSTRDACIADHLSAALGVVERKRAHKRPSAADLEAAWQRGEAVDAVDAVHALLRAPRVILVDAASRWRVPELVLAAATATAAHTAAPAALEASGSDLGPAAFFVAWLTAVDKKIDASLLRLPLSKSASERAARQRRRRRSSVHRRSLSHEGDVLEQPPGGVTASAAHSDVTVRAGSHSGVGETAHEPYGDIRGSDEHQDASSTPAISWENVGEAQVLRACVVALEGGRCETLARALTLWDPESPLVAFVHFCRAALQRRYDDAGAQLRMFYTATKTSAGEDEAAEADKENRVAIVPAPLARQIAAAVNDALVRAAPTAPARAALLRVLASSGAGARFERLDRTAQILRESGADAAQLFLPAKRLVDQLAACGAFDGARDIARVHGIRADRVTWDEAVALVRRQRASCLWEHESERANLWETLARLFAEHSLDTPHISAAFLLRLSTALVGEIDAVEHAVLTEFAAAFLRGRCPVDPVRPRGRGDRTKTAAADTIPEEDEEQMSDSSDSGSSAERNAHEELLSPAGSAAALASSGAAAAAPVERLAELIRVGADAAVRPPASLLEPAIMRMLRSMPGGALVQAWKVELGRDSLPSRAAGAPNSVDTGEVDPTNAGATATAQREEDAFVAAVVGELLQRGSEDEARGVAARGGAAAAAALEHIDQAREFGRAAAEAGQASSIPVTASHAALFNWAQDGGGNISDADREEYIPGEPRGSQDERSQAGEEEQEQPAVDGAAQYLKKLTDLCAMARGGVAEHTTRILASARAAVLLGLSYDEAEGADGLDLVGRVLQAGGRASLRLCRSLACARQLSGPAIARIFAEQYVAALEDVARCRREVAAADSPVPARPRQILVPSAGAWTSDDFEDYARTCGDPMVFGAELFGVAQRRDAFGEEARDVAWDMDEDAELLTMTLFAFERACSIDGSRAVFDLIRSRSYVYVRAGQYRLLARLLTATKKYHDMQYMFDMLLQSEQFEVLLGRSGGLKEYLSQGELAQALARHLQQHHPSDVENLTYVYIRFRMYREHAEMVYAGAVEDVHLMCSRKREERFDPMGLLRISEKFQAAASNFQEAKCHARVVDCLRMCELIHLQVSLGESVQIIGAGKEDAQKFVASCDSFESARVVADAHKFEMSRDWIWPLYVQAIQHGNTEFLGSFLASCGHSRSVFDGISEHFKRDTEREKYVREMQRALSLCIDLSQRAEIAESHLPLLRETLDESRRLLGEVL